MLRHEKTFSAWSCEVLDLVEVRVNCEQNSLLYLVRPRRGCAPRAPKYLRTHVAAKDNGRLPHKGAGWSVTAILLLSQNR